MTNIHVWPVGDLATGVASGGEGGMSGACLISFNNQCFNTLLR